MSLPEFRERRPERAHEGGSPWWERLLPAALVTIVGVVIGVQFWTPNKRVVPVLLGLIVCGVAWQLSIVDAIGVLVLALPYPRGTVFGNTNMAFILVLLVIWLLRVTLRQAAAPRPSGVDGPIAGLFVAYILSFYNVRNGEDLGFALQNFMLFIACIGMFYLIVNNVRTERDLQRLHGFQIAGAVTVFLLAIYELNHPGAAFIAGWLDFSATTGTEFNLHNIRVGASFRDYELLSEFCGVYTLLAIFLLVRASSNTRRALYVAFIGMAMFVMFTTVTRGVFYALALAVPYLMWMLRRHIKFVPLVSVAGAVVALFAFMNWFVASFTRSGNLFERLAEGHVEKGLGLEARTDIWANAWGRMMVHPLIGQGPYYAEVPGHSRIWPHNVYLYIGNITGLLGLGFFLFLLFRLFRMTLPKVSGLRHASYSNAYLIIVQTQLVLFMVNEMKIDYLRNAIYQFEVWMLFATWAAAWQVSRSPEALATLEPGPQPMYRRAA